MTNEIKRIEAVDSINYALSLLDKKSRYVVVCHILLGFTLQEIGISLGITHTRVSVIEKNAIRKLRHPIRLKWMYEASEALA